MPKAQNLSQILTDSGDKLTLAIKVHKTLTHEINSSLWENDEADHLYLDITGTTGIFGPPVDCSNWILRDIFDQTEIKLAAVVACNKLVSKITTQRIKHIGLIQVYAGTEADYLISSGY